MRTPRSGPARSALALAVATLLCTAPAAAQGVTSALRVVVTDASTGEPIRDARAQLRGTRVAANADAEGRIVLSNLAPGPVVVEVTRLGYTAAATSVSLQSGAVSDLAVELRVDPVALEALNAEAGPPGGWAQQMLKSRGFFERRAAGPGVFMERAEIMRNHPRSMTQLLSRHRRLNLPYDAWSTTPLERRGTRPAHGALQGCRPAFFLDGVLVEGFDVNSVRPDNVEALEIYRGSSELPPAFNRGTSGCGAVVIWTRVN